MSHGHLEKQMDLAEEQIAQLMAKAEDADSTPLEDGLSIPDEIKRREDRIAKLKKAMAVMQRHNHGRSIEQLERRDDPPEPSPGTTVAEIMRHRLETKAGKELYGLRKQTVEPVFGIIKEVLGFRRFSMRGLAKCNLEWDLVNTSYNLKGLLSMGMRFNNA